MQKINGPLILIALASGWLIDYLFWQKAWGVSFPLMVGILLAAGIALLRLDGRRLHPLGRVLLLPIGFFALAGMIRLEPMSRLLAVVFTLLSMALLAVTAVGGRWPEYRLLDYITRALSLAGSMIVGGGQVIAEARQGARTNPERKGGSLAGAVGRGALLALPALSLFIALLASADLIFAQRLQDLTERFRLERLPEYVLRLFLIAIAAYVLAGVFLHAVRRSGDENIGGDPTSPASAPLGFVEAIVVLGSVCGLFAIFVGFQFQYFFSGRANIRLDGFTYAEYARRGFGELVAVAFFSLLLFVGLSALTRRETPGRRRIFSALGGLLTLLVGLILASAFQRLLLYESVYGFSRLRTYPHVFMVWLGLLLLAAALLEAASQSRRFMLALVLAMIGFAATLNLINVDGLIARRNVELAAGGRELDVAYLAGLSADAVPDLARQYRRTDLPAPVHDAVGAALVCLRERGAPPAAAETADERAAPEVPADGSNRAAGSGPWQSFHLSHRLAERELAALAPSLNAYTLSRGRLSYGSIPGVITPLGEGYTCIEVWD